MTIRPLITFPDALLRGLAAPVTDFDDALRALAADLLDTLRAAPGIGITAPHIGLLKRVVVLELSAEDGVRTYVNPKIIWSSPELILGPEGSISMPGVTEELERSTRVRVLYQDLEGREQVEEAEGLRAVCHQHEIDQLDGIFWTQRLSRLKRERLLKRYGKARRVPQAGR